MEIDASSKQEKLQKLRCSVQKYDWGRLGRESKVARLFALNSGVEVVDDVPYAEFWMGTHESGPSFVAGSGGESLKAWILRNPSGVGDKVVQRWGPGLPFLFKVLSVAKALSIQAHPDKDLARALHKTHPNVYKDDNHKPEMALAVTEFEALCGFVSLEELKAVLHNVPEIAELVGSKETNQLLDVVKQDGEEKVKAVLQLVFTRLMSADKGAISRAVSKITNRLNIENKVRELTDKEHLVLQLEKQYPADIGVISAFFLNYVKLNPGEALYLGANEPHAYLYGECIECMATSDNVVRAGLTPKHRDVQTLCSMLTYKQGFPEILRGARLGRYIRRYTPPFDEFEVDRCVLPKGASTVFHAVPGPSIFLAMAGEGKMHVDVCGETVTVTEGDVVFAPADTEIKVMAPTGELELYRAGVNHSFHSLS